MNRCYQIVSGNLKTVDHKGRLGTGRKPKGKVLILSESSEKGDVCLTKKVSDMRKKGQDAVLQIRSKAGLEKFKKKYGEKTDWDKVKRDWGGIEMKDQVTVWNKSAIAPIFIIYTLPYCPYCKDVVNTLDKLAIPYTNYIVQDHEKEHYKQQHEWDTFPQVFLVGKDHRLHFIGGTEEFHQYLKGVQLK